MEKNISEEELSLRKRARRRLLGVITLVIAAIIILPIIFDEEPKEAQREIIVLLPEENAADAPDPIIHLVDELTKPEITDDVFLIEQQLPSEQPAPIDILEDRVTVLTEQNYIPVPGNKPEQASNTTKLTTTAEPQPTTASNEFVVQLGAFSDHSKAQHQQQNLVTNGINAYTEILVTSNQKMMRVRVGPFSSRLAAEDELNKLKRLGLNGVVTAK
jgi:DedD protein